MAWGVEIETGRIRLCRATGRSGRIRLGAHREVELPSAAIQPSFKESNLKDPAGVLAALQGACRQTGCRGWVGVALPDAVFSLRCLLTEAAPPARPDAQRFLAWQARELLPFPADEARVDFLPPLPAPDGRFRVVCLFAREQVIREYENLLEAAGLRAAVVDARSVCLTQAGIAGPPEGIVGFLSLREDRSTFLLLEEGRPRFWRNLPYGRTDWGGASRLRAFRELADSITYCEEAEGIGKLGSLTVEGGGRGAHDLPLALGDWLGLSVRPLQLGAQALANDPEELGSWGAAIGAAIRPW